MHNIKHYTIRTLFKYSLLVSVLCAVTFLFIVLYAKRWPAAVDVCEPVSSTRVLQTRRVCAGCMNCTGTDIQPDGVPAPQVSVCPSNTPNKPAGSSSQPTLPKRCWSMNRAVPEGASYLPFCMRACVRAWCARACLLVGQHQRSRCIGGMKRSTVPRVGSANDTYRFHPWRAPGSAPVTDPCGTAGGTTPAHSGAYSTLLYSTLLYSTLSLCPNQKSRCVLIV